MAAAEQLITANLDIWLSAIRIKSTAGRGSSKKLELYGIAKLRELILELAVRGLLVPQDPKDEPAIELLKKIAAEKAKLLKDGKIKKRKALKVIKEDEQPFRLPMGWQFARLGILFNSIDSGGTPSKGNPDYWGGSIPWASVKDLGSKRYISETQDHITKEGLENGSRLARPGDLLICTRMGLGKVAVVQEPMAYNQDLKGISISSNCDADFFINAYATLKLKGTGTTVKGIKQEQLLGYVIGLPPLKEQRRIVAKVDELMALCDQLEQQQETSITAHQTLVQTVLDALTMASERDGFTAAWARIADHFDTLFTTEWSIDQLKQTILQLAIMGKLVPQDPNDEPASELLKNIAAEKTKLVKDGKIKKQKTLPDIEDYEKPFELPQGWEWSRFGSVTSTRLGKMLDKAKNVGEMRPYLRNTNVQWHRFKLDDLKLMKISEEEIEELLLRPGDLLICEGGEPGRCAIWTDDGTEMYFQKALHRARTFAGLLPEYLQICLTADALTGRLDQYFTGATIKHFVGAKLASYAIPLPPADEQRRVVAAVCELMGLCDNLRNRINTAQSTQLQMADAMAERAVA